MANLSYDDVMQWSVDDVLTWLRKNNFAEFHDFVSIEKIDGPDFIKLDKERLLNSLHCKKVSKAKREGLLKHLKDSEKERIKMQKSGKTANARPLPAVKVHPPSVRVVPPRPEEVEVEDVADYDEDEWDDQGVYDNDENLQLAMGRRIDPPPPPTPTQPPNDDESDEDYVEPGVNPGPTGRPPPPPPTDDDDDLYEKANQATVPGRTINPPSRGYAAPPKRSVPPAPAQGPNVPPPRGGGRAPVPPSPRQLVNEESPPVSLPPRSRNAPSPPPPAIPRPSGPTAPKTPVRSDLRGREPLPVPHDYPEQYEPTDQMQQDRDRDSPQEIYEAPDENEMKPPFLPPGRDARIRPPSPPSEFYEDPQEPVHRVPDYESVEEMRNKMNQLDPSGIHRRPPAPMPPADPNEMYEPTDTVPRAPLSARLPPPPATHEEENNYEETEKFQTPPPQPPPSRPGHRAPPPKPVSDTNEDNNEATDEEEQQMTGRREDPPPEKPEKLHLGNKALGGVPAIGIGLNTEAVRDAKNKLRPAIPKEFGVANVTAAKPRPDEAKGVGGIREMFQSKAQQPAKTQPQVTQSKVSHTPPPRAAAAIPPSSTAVSPGAPGAPEPPTRTRGRAPLPGPPGGPPEPVLTPPVVAPPAADSSDIKKQPWYFGDCGRDKANQMLMESREEGTYLVRDSKGSGQPYTLGIFYKGDTFNISIRKRPDGKFALGTEKPDEHVFETVKDMIKFHGNNAIEVSKTGVLAGRVKLVKVAEK